MRKTLVMFALAILPLAGCDAERPVPSGKGGLTRLTLNVNPTLTYAPIMIAKDEGFFEQEGIDAELVSLDSNSAVTAATVGKIDVLSAGVRSGVFNMILRGLPLQVVADKGHSGPEECVADAFIAPLAAAARIEKAGGSLRGERVVLVRGGVMEFLTMKLLEWNQLQPEDVTILHLPQGSAASSRDEVDAVRLITEPNLSAALSEGWAKTIVSAQDVAPGHQLAMLLYGRRLLQDEPELGHRFMRAYLRGVRRYREGKTDRNVAILARHTKLPEEVIRRACWTAISGDGRIRPEAVQPFLDWALQRNYLDRMIAPAQWWNPAYVDAANRQLGPEAR